MGCYSIAGLPLVLSLPLPIDTPGWREAHCVQEHNAVFPGRAQTWVAEPETRAKHLWFIFIISITLLAFEPTSPLPLFTFGVSINLPGVSMDI